MTAAVEFDTRDDVVHAVVPETFSAPLSALVALARGQLSGIWIDWVAVREAYLYGRGRPFPIAHRRSDAANDEKAKIRFSADGLEAYLVLYPPKPKGRRLSETELMTLVRAYGIPPEVLDIHAVRTVHARRTYREPECIAQGCAPVDGTPAWIRWHSGLPIDPEGFLAALDERGVYPELVLGAVTEGEEIGERHSPGMGTPGNSVRGEPIPARPGQDLIKLGDGLGIDPGGRAIVATRKGHLRLAGRGGVTAEIAPLLQVGSPSELRPWAMSVYPGSVVVYGDLEVTFPVRILGDMEVRGGVVRSPIEVMGSLFVRDGIIQHPGEPIKVGGLVSAAFYERAWVVARTAHIRRHSLKSRIVAMDLVTCPKTATIHGGEVGACKAVNAGSLGSRNAMPTEVALSLPGFTGVFQNLYKGWADLLEQESCGDGPQEQIATAALYWREAAERVPGPESTSVKIAAHRLYAGVTVRMGTASRRIETAVGPVELAYEQIGPRGRVAMTRL
jgi:uncharacterized protein (DUF342 family)